MATAPAPSTARRDRLVIAASSLGTVFEWYDFYLYGLLATIISSQFFSGVNETTGFIFALAAFAAGFAVRPFGALVFGRIGDLVGRKYTFLVTMAIMGLSTFLVGLLPSYATRRSRRAGRPGDPAPAPGPGARRRIWRRRHLCRRACAARAPRLLHELDPDDRDPRPVRGPARRHRHPHRARRGGLRRLGLAGPVPALDPAARRVAVDPAPARGEPGLPAR